MDLNARPIPSRQLTELISRALLDEELREKLFEDPERVAQAFDLPRAEILALQLMDRRKFEQAVAQLRWG